MSAIAVTCAAGELAAMTPRTRGAGSVDAPALQFAATR